MKSDYLSTHPEAAGIKLHPFTKRLVEQLLRVSSRKERRQLLRAAGQNACAELPLQLDKLEKLLLQYSPFAVMATFAFYDLTYLPDVGERLNESDPIEQSHIEFVQALILRHEESEFKMRMFSPPEFQEIRDLAVYVSVLHSAKDFSAVNDEMPTEEPPLGYREWQAAQMQRAECRMHSELQDNCVG